MDDQVSVIPMINTRCFVIHVMLFSYIIHYALLCSTIDLSINLSIYQQRPRHHAEQSLLRYRRVQVSLRTIRGAYGV